MTAEGEVRRSCSMYVDGLIDVEELERRVWDALTGGWSPTSAFTSILKEAWTESWVSERHDWDDGKGRVHAISLEEHKANLRRLRLECSRKAVEG